MSTTQLKRGGAHEKSFEDICPNYGLKVVKQWGSGNKNKKNNCDADFTIEIVNLKKFESIVPNKKFKIGDYRLRFKAAGGKVCSSWKINVELNQ